MGIPDLDPEGYLPAGVHDCSLDDIRVRFGSFQTTDRRCKLFDRLNAYFADARQSDWIAAVVIDGSFTTAKPSPEDIDLVLLLHSDVDFSTELRPFEYNVLSRRAVRKQFGFDVLVAREGSPLAQRYVEFFEQVRERPDRRKGVLRVRF